MKKILILNLTIFFPLFLSLNAMQGGDKGSPHSTQAVANSESHDVEEGNTPLPEAIRDMIVQKIIEAHPGLEHCHGELCDVIANLEPRYREALRPLAQFQGDRSSPASATANVAADVNAASEAFQAAEPGIQALIAALTQVAGNQAQTVTQQQTTVADQGETISSQSKWIKVLSAAVGLFGSLATIAAAVAAIMASIYGTSSPSCGTNSTG